MDEFEEKIKEKLEEMRADILSKTKIPLHIPKEERADITDLISVEKIRNVENISISIHTDILKLIEIALDKIQNGNYGYCEICGDKIDKERLEEMPYTMYCIACQEQIELEERSLKVKGGILISKKEEEIRKEKKEQTKNFLLTGKTCYWNGDLNKAIENFTQAISLDPDNAYLYSLRGKVYYEKGEFDKSIEDFTEAIRLNPRDYYFYYRRGKAYYRKRIYDKAIEDFTEAIKLKPHYAFLYHLRGKAYLYTCSEEEAIRDLSEAIELEPHNPQYERSRFIIDFLKTVSEKLSKLKKEKK
jgi:RNA polymerase-binding transcription factor DksA